MPLARKAEMLSYRVHLADYLALRDIQAQAIDDLMALGAAHGDMRWVASALLAQFFLAYRTGRLAQAFVVGRRGAEAAESIDYARAAA